MPGGQWQGAEKIENNGMKKLLILDFDGTMGDTRSLIVRTMRQTLEHLGLPMQSEEACAAMIGLPLRETFTQLMPMSEETGRRCEETYNRLFTANNVAGAVPLFEGVRETVAEVFSRGVTVTIASSRGRDSLADFVRDLGLSPYIAHLVSAWDVEHAKPAPDMVLRLLKLTGMAAAYALVVGDTKYDIMMGRSAGVDTCGVTYGNGSLRELVEAGATHVADCFSDILPLVLE